MGTISKVNLSSKIGRLSFFAKRRTYTTAAAICYVISLTICSISYAEDITPNFTAGGKYTFTIKSEPPVSYYVTFPKSYISGQKLPLIITFAPGTKAEGLMKKIAPSIDKIGWILVSCNRLRNQAEVADEIKIQTEDDVLDDVFSKIPHDTNKVYLGGYSSGTQISFSISARRTEKFLGLLSLCGWLGGKKGKDRPYPKGLRVAMLNGNDDDITLGWTDEDTETLEARSCVVKRWEFPGEHAVAPAPVIGEALVWLVSEDQKQTIATIECIYKKKDYLEAYRQCNDAQVLASEESELYIKTEEFKKLVITQAEGELKKILGKSRVYEKDYMKFIDRWGKDTELTSVAREKFNAMGEIAAAELLEAQPHDKRKLNTFLKTWSGYECEKPICAALNVIGEAELEKLRGGRPTTSDFMNFVKAWISYPCSAAVIEELNPMAQEEVDKVLSSKKVSATRLISAIKKWDLYPACDKAKEALALIAAKELSEIKEIEKESSRKSKLKSFAKKYPGTPSAEEAAEMLASL